MDLDQELGIMEKKCNDRILLYEVDVLFFVLSGSMTSAPVFWSRGKCYQSVCVFPKIWMEI